MKRICASSWSFTKNHYMIQGQQNVKRRKRVFARSLIATLFHSMILYVNNKVLFLLQQGSNHFWRRCSPFAQNNKLTLSQLNVINHSLKRGVSQLPLYHSLLLTPTPVIVKCSALLLCIYRVLGSDLRQHNGCRPWRCYDLPQSIQKNSG